MILGWGGVVFSRRLILIILIIVSIGEDNGVVRIFRYGWWDY